MGDNEDVLKSLVADPNIKRIAGFVNGAFVEHQRSFVWVADDASYAGAFAIGAPKLYKHYEETLTALLEHDDELVMPYDNSVQAATTFNFGPKTATKKHRDGVNLACGWCAVTPLGRFDYKKGGHLVFHQFKVIVELPPHVTALFMSAIVDHSNLPVQEHEVRMSVTHYTAGPIFRWVEYGFRTEKTLAAEDPEEMARQKALRPQRWEQALARLSKYEELESDIRRVFGLAQA